MKLASRIDILHDHLAGTIAIDFKYREFRSSITWIDSLIRESRNIHRPFFPPGFPYSIGHLQYKVSKTENGKRCVSRYRRQPLPEHITNRRRTCRAGRPIQQFSKRGPAKADSLEWIDPGRSITALGHPIAIPKQRHEWTKFSRATSSVNFHNVYLRNARRFVTVVQSEVNFSVELWGKICTFFQRTPI